MGFIKKFFHSFSVKGYIRDVLSVLPIYRSLDLYGRTDEKVNAVLACAYLIEHGKYHDKDFTKVLECMEGKRKFEEYPQEIIYYSLKMGELKKQAYSGSSLINQKIANGLTLWILSLRALTTSEIRPYVSEIWEILENSDKNDYFEKISTIQLLLGKNPIGETLTNLKQSFKVPSLFSREG